MDLSMGDAAHASGKSQPAGAIVKRHPFTIRATHWLGALALLVLFMSGLQIFNAAPYLDASSVSDPAHRVLDIGESGSAMAGTSAGRTTIFGHGFTTTHVLGFTDDGQGSETGRAFPGWITMPAQQDLAAGRQWHFFFGWVLVACGIAYFSAGFARGELQKLVLRPADLPKLWPMQAYYFRLRKEPPDHGQYNPLQKAGYTGVVFVLLPFLILTGLCMSPGIDTIAHPVVDLLGGRQFARTWHFLAMLFLVAFTFGHIGLVLSTGVINNMRSMTLGTYRLGEHEGTGA